MHEPKAALGLLGWGNPVSEIRIFRFYLMGDSKIFTRHSGCKSWNILIFFGNVDDDDNNYGIDF